MYLSSRPGFCQTKRMDGFCLYVLMILLIRSGDVESNPGPDRNVSEKELLRLSKKIETSFYTDVGINLDISRVELGQIKERSQNSSDALLTVFTRWRDKQPTGTDIRALLAEELKRSDLVSLSDGLLAGSLVPPKKQVLLTETRNVSEKEFFRLSKKIEPSFYKEVGINLDISIAELGQIKERSQNASDALMTVFTRWRDKQPTGTDIRALLAEELESSDLGALSGSLVPKKHTDTTTSFPSSPNTSTSTTTTPTTAAAASATSTTTCTTQEGLLPSTKDFDDILVEVAKRVRKESEIDTLGKKLNFFPGDIQGYIQTNHKTQNVTYDGTLLMLRDWQKGQRKSTEREALKIALEQSRQIRLADDLFPSS